MTQILSAWPLCDTHAVRRCFAAGWSAAVPADPAGVSRAPPDPGRSPRALREEAFCVSRLWGLQGSVPPILHAAGWPPADLAELSKPPDPATEADSPCLEDPAMERHLIQREGFLSSRMRGLQG